MNKLNCQLKYLFLGLSLIGAPLSFAADCPTEDVEHITVGTRLMSSLEEYEQQKERSEISEKNKRENWSKNPNCSLTEDDEEDLKERKTFYTSHEGVFHHPVAVSKTGNTVTLADGSLWHVRKNDRFKTLDWLSGDSLLILPNHSWFSSYKFVLLNQNTGKKVKVNMLLGPIYNGIFTHWVVDIDYVGNKLWLEDGTVWDISGFDKSKLNKWLINDTVIIGINDSFCSSKPNVLINVNVLNYVAGLCLN